MKSGVIAIVGRPNVGKSSLLNAVLGSRLSAVSDRPQTTRERVKGILTEDRGQILFVDTPGLGAKLPAKSSALKTFLEDEAVHGLEGPDLIWYLVDLESTLEREEVVIHQILKSHSPIWVLFSRWDRYASHFQANQRAKTFFEQIANRLKVQNLRPPCFISTRDPAALQSLMDSAWAELPSGPPLFPGSDSLSDRPLRFFFSEWIREKLFEELKEEVPYACAVRIDEVNERCRPYRIEATVLVERESQKGIVIGQGASMIKRIGQKAREQIEEFLGHPVFLGLKVKVLSDWSSDKMGLKRAGYDSA